MDRLMTRGEAAERLGATVLEISQIIECGSVVPAVLEVGAAGLWGDGTEIGISEDDLPAFAGEISRRRFTELRTRHAAILAKDAELFFGPGWTEIFGGFLDMAERDFAGGDLIVERAKEKFGSLVVACAGGDERVSEALASLAAQSRSVCEECGAPGRLRLGKTLVKTTCDTHVRFVLPLRPEDGKYLDFGDWMRDIATAALARTGDEERR